MIPIPNDTTTPVGVTYPVGVAGTAKWQALTYGTALPDPLGTNFTTAGGLAWNWYLVVY